jgi:hypothetical protein
VKITDVNISCDVCDDHVISLEPVINKRSDYTGLEITADQRSMIGRKLFLIGEEATLPFILIGKKYI